MGLKSLYVAEFILSKKTTLSDKVCQNGAHTVFFDERCALSGLKSGL